MESTLQARQMINLHEIHSICDSMTALHIGFRLIQYSLRKSCIQNCGIHIAGRFCQLLL